MSHVSRLAALAAAVLALGASAQQVLPAAAAGAAALTYTPVLEGYRSFSEQEVKSWPQANHTVGAIGGWREYAREAQQPAGAAPGTSAPDQPARPGAQPATGTGGGHAGHH